MCNQDYPSQDYQRNHHRLCKANGQSIICAKQMGRALPGAVLEGDHRD